MRFDLSPLQMEMIKQGMAYIDHREATFHIRDVSVKRLEIIGSVFDPPEDTGSAAERIKREKVANRYTGLPTSDVVHTVLPHPEADLPDVNNEYDWLEQEIEDATCALVSRDVRHDAVKKIAMQVRKAVRKRLGNGEPV
jgi:hypothetical protein